MTYPTFTPNGDGTWTLDLATPEQIATGHMETLDLAVAAFNHWTKIGQEAVAAGDIATAQEALERATSARSAARHYRDRVAAAL